MIVTESNHLAIGISGFTGRVLELPFEISGAPERDSIVLLTEKGKPRYRLTLYTPARIQKAPPVDYWARLNAYQPQAMTEAQARALHEENRGDR